ncbi:MAG: hypothetical protein H6682_21515 [Candidatus Eisenbacteria bacterium]|nr:hypothetical protein [Candidatus Eisenbacteria bacterium]
MSTRAPHNPNALLRLALIAIGLLACLQTGALGSGLLPPERVALLLFKVIPYNQVWDGAEALRFEVVATGRADLDRATAIADYLEAYSEQAQKKGATTPRLTASVVLLDELESLTQRPEPPAALLLIGGRDVPTPSPFEELARAAVLRSILIVSDTEERLMDSSSLAFVHSTKSNRPEMVLRLERSKAQGARFTASFIRLVRLWEEPR